MFGVFRTANIFLFIFLFKLAVGDQESLSYANCQLTNTCFIITTDELANERSTTSKITDDEDTYNTETSLTTSENEAPSTTSTLASLHTTDEPSREPTCNGKTKQDYNATPYSTTPIQQATNRESQAPTETSEFEETSAVPTATVDALKSTRSSKTSKVYTISPVSKFDPLLCMNVLVIKMKDLIYVLCGCISFPKTTLRAYQDSIPHNLLMITIAEKCTWSQEMVGLEKTGTLYVSEMETERIWKIDPVGNKVDLWKSRVGFWFWLSVANDNQVGILVLKAFEDLLFEIYDQEANLVRSVSLPNELSFAFSAIQKTNGEIIVSHRSLESYDMCISFLSIDGRIISQFKLRETVGFKDAQMFSDTKSDKRFATEMFTENVYISDWNTRNWNLTGLSVNISNSPEDGFLSILSFRSTDGRQFTIEGEETKQDVQLFFDTDNNNLFAAENVFGNIYLLDTKTQNWSEIGLIQYDASLFYDREKKQFIALLSRNVHIWAVNEN